MKFKALILCATLVTGVVVIGPSVAVAAPNDATDVKPLQTDAEVRRELAELQQRFKERYPTLVRLVRAGKVGETYQGLAGVVEAEYAAEKLDPDDEDSITIATFVERENRDRLRLFELMAAQLETTPAKVAAREAKRRYDRLDPDEHFQLQGRPFLTKRAIEAERAERE